MATSKQTTLPALEMCILPADLPEALQYVQLCKNATSEIHALIHLNNFDRAWTLTKQLHTAMNELREMARRKSDHDRGYRKALEDAAERDELIRQLMEQATASGAIVTFLHVGGGRRE
ncbi:hypothetical protein CIG75_12945 [Tumebacillus algifaecis]|uniref:Uncharacterized protein n=1 Tax=Tumebacillus algifaecis TaxID=1214604 RepID=A0A223D342_9BACL|nr:hypothetical protein [Tumebacillus algifaecis]ASS75806.1 hypothetical protein CIG75_12945 [Tumebacillus algifaecis]